MNEMKLMMAEMELAKMATATTLLAGNAGSLELLKVLKELQAVIAKAQQQVVVEQMK